MSPKRADKGRSATPEGRTRPRRRWPWIGLGLLGAAGLGAAGLGVLLGTAGSRDVTRRRRDEGCADEGDGDTSIADPFALPDAVDEAWIPGPSGSLRMVERHSDAEMGLLFVHGLGGRLEHWSAQLGCLGPGLGGVAFDLPGHGQSDAAGPDAIGSDAIDLEGADLDGADLGGASPIDEAAASIGAALAASAGGRRRPLVVAHAWGCLAALRWAATHPTQACGLLLLDPPADQSRMESTDVDAFVAAIKDDVRGELGFFLRQSLTEVPAAIAQSIAADVESTPTESLRAGLLDSSRATPAADAASARMPIHVASSDLGRLPQSIESLVPSATAWRLPGDSHWAMLARPDQLNQLLDDVLDSLRA